ncbi:MAG: hypothetical protein KC493_06650 [Bacteriovoracaceae bacterium]|nr:hypothetical protein [Bacteriovoracaceae bacterium]
MGLFNDRTKKDGKTGVPAWFMRQAGRYHSHYQGIKKDSDFMSMCKTPDLAIEVTMGPIRDFDFDASILFSDLLFPLEQLGMGLKYAPGPILDLKIQTKDDLKKLSVTAPANEFYEFQKKACLGLRTELPKEKTLLGFVGAPWTLYSYAVEGGHSGNLTSSKLGLHDGRWEGFCDILIPELVANMEEQAKGNIDAICLFDTAAGELDVFDYTQFILPKLRKVTKEFKQKYPNIPIIYYSKHTHVQYFREIQDDNISVLGIDWRMDLPSTLKEFSKDYMIQGNFDPSHLHLPWNLLEGKLNDFFERVQSADVDMSRWIMGLGHGVLQHTPEDNVRNTIKLIHDRFLY